MGLKKIVLSLLAVALLLFGGFHLYAQNEMRSIATLTGAPISFAVMRGDTTVDVARHLREAGVISHEMVFLYYLLESKQWGKFVAGQYHFSGQVSFEGIAKKLIEGDVIPRSVKITFPEGFTAKQIAARLTENGLPGEKFLSLVRSPSNDILSVSILFQGLPSGTSLEGFLFPDTYEFSLQASASDITLIFLKNFDRRFDDALRVEMKRQGKTLLETVTMASILEVEVRSEIDRRLVSDLFWRRLSVGMPLQSDATVRYALGIDKAQYSGKDIATDSPYNTYVYKGLPKGPIDNPGSIALKAALFPTPNEYWYFLSDLSTGETVFSRDFEEHKRNKAAHGL